MKCSLLLMTLTMMWMPRSLAIPDGDRKPAASSGAPRAAPRAAPAPMPQTSQGVPAAAVVPTTPVPSPRGSPNRGNLVPEPEFRRSVPGVFRVMEVIDWINDDRHTEEHWWTVLMSTTKDVGTEAQMMLYRVWAMVYSQPTRGADTGVPNGLPDTDAGYWWNRLYTEHWDRLPEKARFAFLKLLLFGGRTELYHDILMDIMGVVGQERLTEALDTLTERLAGDESAFFRHWQARGLPDGIIRASWVLLRRGLWQTSRRTLQAARARWQETVKKTLRKATEAALAHVAAMKAMYGEGEEDEDGSDSDGDGLGDLPRRRRVDHVVESEEDSDTEEEEEEEDNEEEGSAARKRKAEAEDRGVKRQKRGDGEGGGSASA